MNNENKKNNLFINELQKSGKLLDLQRRFEEGSLKEIDLTEEEKSELIKLYKDQIASLQIDIEADNRIIQQYKQEIILEQKN